MGTRAFTYEIRWSGALGGRAAGLLATCNLAKTCMLRREGEMATKSERGRSLQKYL